MATGTNTLQNLSQEWVILVDEQDREIGRMEKMEAHLKGALHRAFSVFVFNQNQELILQRRADGKYHCPGLWTNTCCSHPRPEEAIGAAAYRRLREEMGLECDLEYAFSFTYYAELDRDLIEHEVDHVFFGWHNGFPELNPEEASAWKYRSLPDIQSELRAHPERFTPWFKICLEEVVSRFQQFQATKAIS